MRNLAEFSGGSAARYFTPTRRKNEDGAPSGVTIAFTLPFKVSKHYLNAPTSSTRFSIVFALPHISARQSTAKIAPIFDS